MATHDMSTINSEDYKEGLDYNGSSKPEAPDMVELWEDSDVGSSHGSFMLSRNCWVPPVLKTDKVNLVHSAFQGVGALYQWARSPWHYKCLAPEIS